MNTPESSAAMQDTAAMADATDRKTFAFTVTLKDGMTRAVTAFRRTAGAPWTIKPRLHGRQRWASLYVIGDSKADLALVKVRAKLFLEKLQAERFAPPVERVAKVKPVATLGALFAAYRAGIALETEIRTDTVLDNVAAARLFGREAMGKDNAAVEACAATVLTGELVERWQDARMRAAGEEKLARSRARRGMDGVLRKVRSLFTKEALNVYRKAGLTLPDLTGFRAVPLKGGWNASGYVPIEETVVEAMNRAAWAELRVQSPAAFLTFLLMLRCGLRNSECEHARRCWLERGTAVVMREGKPVVEQVAFLAVIERAGWDGPKNGRNHRIPLAPDVLAELEALGADDYLLGGTAQERFDVTHRTVCDFVRRFLPSREEDAETGRVKAAYELRKHFGAMVASTQGLDRAAEYLGDRRDTVEKHYHAWLQGRDARPLLASELTPNVLAAVAA